MHAPIFDMKLVTYKTEKGYGLGAVVEDYVLDLKALGSRLSMLELLDLGAEGMAQAGEAVKEAQENLASGNLKDLMRLGDISLVAPIPRTRKNIVCMGLNYAEHVKEGGSDRPLPLIYSRAVERLDYEVELAFVIGKEGKYIPKDEALDHIAGYMVFQDISARTLQRQHNQWYRGKSLDTFAPVGPYLVTADEVEDPQNLDLWCKVNGEIRQKANTSDMIFDVKTIISTLSDGITLEVGDVFATGTPSGVGAAHPSGLLKVGDVIESGVEGLGVIRNKVVSEK